MHVPLLHHDADLLRQRPAPPRHVYTTVVADALARYHRARGTRAFFLTGLDEHGQKIERIAARARDQRAGLLRRDRGEVPGDLERFGISNDDFIRTTRNAETRATKHQESPSSPRCGSASREAPRATSSRREYDGMYCVGCEESRPRTKSSSRTARRSARSTCTPVERGEGEELLLPPVEVRDYAARAVRRRPISFGPSRGATRCARSSSGGLRDRSPCRA